MCHRPSPAIRLGRERRVEAFVDHRSLARVEVVVVGEPVPPAVDVVDAASAEQGVNAGVEVGPAEKAVTTPAALDPVRAAAAGQEVVAGAPEEDVVAAAAEDAFDVAGDRVPLAGAA